MSLFAPGSAIWFGTTRLRELFLSWGSSTTYWHAETPGRPELVESHGTPWTQGIKTPRVSSYPSFLVVPHLGLVLVSFSTSAHIPFALFPRRVLVSPHSSLLQIQILNMKMYSIVLFVAMLATSFLRAASVPLRSDSGVQGRATVNPDGYRLLSAVQPAATTTGNPDPYKLIISAALAEATVASEALDAYRLRTQEIISAASAALAEVTEAPASGCNCARYDPRAHPEHKHSAHGTAAHVCARQCAATSHQ
ncbi:hypothetical protein DFH09DRAFT_1345883 [Mycena vulgaris]|nr:hypothetical protein DFH09DRAFT_1345883 [Mycena vulgaris]